MFPKKIYDYFYAAKSLRNKSSYDFCVDFSEEQANKLILQAEEFITEVEMLL